jgi:hypothetical protein
VSTRCRYDPAVIKTASLRVYLPAVAAELTLEPTVEVRITPTDTEYGLIGEPLTEDLLVAEWRGARYVCPRTPRLRMLEGVLAVRRAYGQLGGGAVIPENAARRARTELEELHRDSPALRSHILTSAWHVPVRWFVPYTAGEREPFQAGHVTSIRYRVELRTGMRRVEHAVSVLSAAGIPDSMVGEVEDLRDWLEPFPPTAMLELSYGRVAELFSEADLAGDDSADEIQRAIAAVEAGDWETAGEYYGSLAYRWAGAVAIGYSS